LAVVLQELRAQDELARETARLNVGTGVHRWDRLTGGGRWIRTSSSARDRLHFDVRGGV